MAAITDCFYPSAFGQSRAGRDVTWVRTGQWGTPALTASHVTETEWRLKVALMRITALDTEGRERALVVENLLLLVVVTVTKLG